MSETSSPLITVRRSRERGRADHGWLESYHSFSFASYQDPAHMGFRSLRVINQDRVAPGAGFPAHPHRDMEIFSYVLEGALKHEDSLGNGGILEPGQIQLMSAGTGITHSEFNPSPEHRLHFLQIWILPHAPGLEPGYTEWSPPAHAADQDKTLLISPDGREGSAAIRQDAEVYRLRLPAGGAVEHDLASERGFWLQVIAGSVHLHEQELGEGDGASSEEPGRYRFEAAERPVEALLFDLG